MSTGGEQTYGERNREASAERSRQLSADVREIGRATQGVRLIRLDEGDRVVAVAKLAPEDEPEGGGAEPNEPKLDQGGPDAGGTTEPAPDA